MTSSNNLAVLKIFVQKMVSLKETREDFRCWRHKQRQSYKVPDIVEKCKEIIERTPTLRGSDLKDSVILFNTSLLCFLFFYQKTIFPKVIKPSRGIGHHVDFLPIHWG